MIDDCALAAIIKERGAIWLGLTERTRSLRAYEQLSDVWDMVARTAFVQLNHSVVNLAGTVIGMVALYLVVPGAVILAAGRASGDGGAAALGLLGAAVWFVMTVLYAPTVRLYRLPLPWALTLPVSGFLYSLMTLSSAVRHWRGRGGAWKGRSYSAAGSVDG